MSQVATPQGLEPTPQPSKNGVRLPHRYRPSRRRAVQMAWFDVCRHRVRAAVTVALVWIPVALVMAVATFADSVSTTPDARFGQSQLVVLPQRDLGEDHSTAGVSVKPDTGDVLVPSAKVPPVEPQVAQFRDQLGALGHGDWVPVGSDTVLPDRAGSATALDRSLMNPEYGVAGRAQLTSGRWPRNADEVVVTDAGVAQGVPTAGTLPVMVNGISRTLTVVGRGNAAFGWGQAHLVGWLDPQAQVAYQSSWLLDPAQPCTLAAVADVMKVVQGTTIAGSCTDFSQYTNTEDAGFAESLWQVRNLRQVQLANLTDKGLDAQLWSILSHPMVFTALVACCLMTGYLVYPALAMFAESSRNNVRRLHENGAPPAQVQWMVTAQAVLLGATGMLLGWVSGVGLAWAAVGVAREQRDNLWHLQFAAPWAVPLVMAAAVVASCAVCAAIVARQAESSSVFTEAKGWRRFGHSVAAASVFYLVSWLLVSFIMSFWETVKYVSFASHAQHMDPFRVYSADFAGFWWGAAVAVVVLVGSWTVLAGASRWGSWAVRLVTRCFTRRLACTTMTVLGVAGVSVLAAVAALQPPKTAPPSMHPITVADGTVLASGDASLWGKGALEVDWDQAAAQVAAALPQAVVHPVVTRVVRPGSREKVMLVATAAEVSEEVPPTNYAYQPDGVNDDQWPLHGVYPFGNAGMVVASAQEATRIYGLSLQQQEAYEAGAVVVPNGWYGPQKQAFVGAGYAVQGPGGEVLEASGVSWVPVPVINVTGIGTNFSVLVPPVLVQQMAAPTQTVGLYVSAPHGFGDADVAALAAQTTELTLVPALAPRPWWVTGVLAAAGLAVAGMLGFTVVMMRYHLRRDLLAVKHLGGSWWQVRVALGVVTALLGMLGSVFGVAVVATLVAATLVKFAGWSSAWESIAQWAGSSGVAVWQLAAFVVIPGCVAGLMIAATTVLPCRVRLEQRQGR